ncbi:hypothetical protein D9619_005040 [Psilocybe cf. subviscida]|uniref:Ornithine decarboxylase n=1 Tax=Psilocybe cf. subviscida TaxID=2480587 RepID=A0A8H5BQY0_9AGAR|nr:hypothetical protein D9619_005040 [Psilocybe cf. subviscida]
MSRLETLAPSTLDFAHNLADPDPYTVAYAQVQAQKHTLRVTADSAVVPPEGLSIFPALPPLFAGHPTKHLREGVLRAAELAANHVPDAEKAFFVADLSEVYKQHMRWRRCLPNVQPFYDMVTDSLFTAVKCNPDPYVIRLLASLGAGFDCASNNEIGMVLDVGGVSPSQIIFANPCKAPSFIRNAAKCGVDLMTFDNADELHKIARINPRARCVVRILTDDSKSLCAFGIKFGAPLQTVPGLLATAKKLNLDVVGVSFHVGSGCYDPTVYLDALNRARRVFDMATEAGYELTLLDVGGGFEDGLFEQAADVIRQGLVKYFGDEEFRRRDGGKGVKFMAEPGRFYVSKAFKLAASIIARRAPQASAPSAEPEQRSAVEEKKDTEDRPEVMYYINDGVYGAFNCILFDHQVITPDVLFMGQSFHVPAPSAAPSETHGVASVWGPTCDSIDCVSPKCVLPRALRVGDWLGFDDMGAYTVCAASQFNGFEVSRVVYTCGDDNVYAGGADVAREVRNALMSFAAEGNRVRAEPYEA